MLKQNNSDYVFLLSKEPRKLKNLLREKGNKFKFKNYCQKLTHTGVLMHERKVVIEK